MFYRKSRPLSDRVPSLKLPEKLKGGLVQKFVDYWRGVFGDYREALIEVRQSAQKKPGKAVAMTSTALTLLYLNRHNPNERSFRDQFILYNQELMMVPRSIRNKESEKQQDSIARCYNQGLIRRWNLGIFSIMWRDNFSDDCGLAASQCSYLKPGYLGFKDRIVDIGILDRWLIMNEKMKDFDISLDEWTEDGAPTKPKEQWQPLWIRTG